MHLGSGTLPLRLNEVCFDRRRFSTFNFQFEKATLQLFTHRCIDFDVYDAMNGLTARISRLFRYDLHESIRALLTLFLIFEQILYPLLLEKIICWSLKPIDVDTHNLCLSFLYGFLLSRCFLDRTREVFGRQRRFSCTEFEWVRLKFILPPLPVRVSY